MKTQRLAWLRAISLAATVLLVACESDSSDEVEDGGPAPTADAGKDPEKDAGSMSPAEDASAPTQDAAADAKVDTKVDASADASAPAAKNIVEIAAGDSRFTSLVAAVKKAGLVDALSAPGPLTVFAPTNDAFTAALAALGKTLDQLTADDLKPILTYHVVGAAVKSTDLKAGPVKMLSGISAFVATSGGAKINGASVVNADIIASNGVIHVIDKVLLPPNLVQAATLAGDFSTLLGAATTAGLVDTLSKADANLTLFAPTNAAFAKLSAVPTGDALKNVLLYHVVAGKVLSTDLKAGAVPTLLTGKSLTVDLTGGVKINTANVVVADVVTTNGVIHVVDTVLVPPT
jgi:transforming growth factor-beta-induced protein